MKETGEGTRHTHTKNRPVHLSISILGSRLHAGIDTKSNYATQDFDS